MTTTLPRTLLAKSESFSAITSSAVRCAFAKARSDGKGGRERYPTRSPERYESLELPRPRWDSCEPPSDVRLIGMYFLSLTHMSVVWLLALRMTPKLCSS